MDRGIGIRRWPGPPQHVCGALTGAAIALGLREGQAAEDPKKTAETVRPRVRALMEGFKERFGGVECRELVPFDFGVPGEYQAFRASGVKQQRCHQYVKYAVEQLLS